MAVRKFKDWHTDDLKTHLALLDEDEKRVRSVPNWTLDLKGLKRKRDAIPRIQRQRAVVHRILAEREAEQKAIDYKAAAVAFARAFSLASDAFWATRAGNIQKGWDKHNAAIEAVCGLPIATIEELLATDTKEQGS